MKYLRHILAFGCMMAWLWLTLHGYGDTEFWIYNDEFGRLLTILPYAALSLAAIACLGGAPHAWKRLERFWMPASFCMMLPVLLGMDAAFLPPHALGYAVSVLAGMGFGVCFVIVGNSIAALPVRGIGLTAGGGMLVASSLLAVIVLLPQNSLTLMAFILTATIKLLVPSPAPVPPARKSGISPAGIMVCSLIYGFTGFSKSIHYALLTIISPWVPDQIAYTLLIPGVSCLFALLCIQLSTRSTRGKSLMLAVPILVMGYTAWPLLHRESLGLSLLTLSFAYTLLDVFCYLSLFCMASRLESASRLRMLGWGGAMLMLGLWIGSRTLPYIQSSLSQGITVNYLFAFLALTLLGSILAFTMILEYAGFWSTAQQGKKDRRLSGEALLEKDGTLPASAALPPELCDTLLREMELTRQQALIARLIVQRCSDMEICAELNISQSTLKTHIRNILKRLGLNSRYEIAWLIVRRIEKEKALMQDAL